MAAATQRSAARRVANGLATGDREVSQLRKLGFLVKHIDCTPVVVLSDSQERLDLIQGVCSRNGLWVRSAKSLSRARAVIAPKDYGVLICDAGGRDYSWQDAVDMVRTAIGRWAVLVVMSRFDANEWVEVLKGGANQVLAEPLTSERLLETIAACAPRRVQTPDLPAPGLSGSGRLRSLLRSFLSIADRKPRS
jgi:DNA-binding NtrC family response regulator